MSAASEDGDQGTPDEALLRLENISTVSSAGQVASALSKESRRTVVLLLLPLLPRLPDATAANEKSDKQKVRSEGCSFKPSAFVSPIKVTNPNPTRVKRSAGWTAMQSAATGTGLDQISKSWRADNLPMAFRSRGNSSIESSRLNAPSNKTCATV